MQPTKGAPTRTTGGTAQSALGKELRTLAEAAFADKGEWYSITQPDDQPANTLRASARFQMAMVAGQHKVSEGRIWMRFNDASD